ncbi:thiamine biosynthesis protein ThiS [Corynebacterium simulans]|uniref:sulfur carrier protein ThiS n=1 Tax=Corynebacterium simulans TaxID=146827 RepID=UPI000780B8E0|nr:sulfur carrier protein ThiS [Corynebacterium simulans]AMO90073.1 thiamine biosynthesis protein ThiS [Corynebacterium simulans]
MTITYNGQKMDTTAATVAALIAEVNAPEAGTAVAINGAVIPRSAWEDTCLEEGAVIDVLTAIQGG